MRSRDFERRQQVEERKRQLFEAEREKREAILKKNQVIIIYLLFTLVVHYNQLFLY